MTSPLKRNGSESPRPNFLPGLFSPKSAKSISINPIIQVGANASTLDACGSMTSESISGISTIPSARSNPIDSFFSDNNKPIDPCISTCSSSGWTSSAPPSARQPSLPVTLSIVPSFPTSHTELTPTATAGPSKPAPQDPFSGFSLYMIDLSVAIENAVLNEFAKFGKIESLSCEIAGPNGFLALTSRAGLELVADEEEHDVRAHGEDHVEKLEEASASASGGAAAHPPLFGCARWCEGWSLLLGDDIKDAVEISIFVHCAAPQSGTEPTKHLLDRVLLELNRVPEVEKTKLCMDFLVGTLTATVQLCPRRSLRRQPPNQNQKRKSIRQSVANFFQSLLRGGRS